uniref:Uncharacterized protein n=1 Tax=Fagus sylvatica TaxID=28930 RepID=A0A2N9GZD1_FAGSY
MSQDVDICEDSLLENAPNDHLFLGERNACSCPLNSTIGSLCFSASDQGCTAEGSKVMCKSPKGANTNEEMEIEGHCVSITGRCPPGFKYDQERDKFGGNEITDLKNVSSSPHEWLDPSFQLNVPLVDVDKVRCIIRNIVRDWAAEGQKERDQCYKPILKELDGLFPNREMSSPPSCLVPGAGLGRLALEISCLDIHPARYSYCL